MNRMNPCVRKECFLRLFVGATLRMHPLIPCASAEVSPEFRYGKELFAYGARAARQGFETVYRNLKGDGRAREVLQGLGLL